MAEPFRFFFQVVIPALAILAGAGLAGLALATSSWPPNAAEVTIAAVLLLPASMLTAAGVFAFAGRRSHPSQAEATSYFLGAAFAAFVTVAAALSFRNTDSPEVVSGELVRVVQDHTRRGPDNLDFRIAGHPDSFTWYCGTPDCGNGAALLALQDQRPLHVELRVVDSRVVGVSVLGRPLLDVDRELRRSRWFAIEVALVAAILGGLCLYLGIRRLRRPAAEAGL